MCVYVCVYSVCVCVCVHRVAYHSSIISSFSTAHLRSSCIEGDANRVEVLDFLTSGGAEAFATQLRGRPPPKLNMSGNDAIDIFPQLDNPRTRQGSRSNLFLVFRCASMFANLIPVSSSVFRGGSAHCIRWRRNQGKGTQRLPNYAGGPKISACSNPCFFQVLLPT